MRLVDKEIRIMSFLDHPHVIHLEEVYEDDTRVCFVMELAQGGEVFDRLIEKVFKVILFSNKGHIFREGHTILRNLPLTFVLCCASQK